MKRALLLILILSGLSVLNPIKLPAQLSGTVKNDSTGIDTTKKVPVSQSYYVVLGNDSLFQITADLGPYPAPNRVELISEQLAKLTKLNNLDTKLFTISEINNYSVISYNGSPIVSIGDDDAKVTGKTRKELAAEYVQIIKTSFDKLIKDNSLSSWIRRIGFTLLSILGLFVIFFLLNKLFGFINNKLVTYEKGIKRNVKTYLNICFPINRETCFLFLPKLQNGF